MAKEDTTPGLLSKVVKFVRNPATNWSELDGKESDREEALSKQMLKEMIERKRRNDFVRKREFDMLRKMRKREAMTGQDPGARPSFFQSSMPSKPDDRAVTLKKIDEIEAQMSMQWWKTKHGSAAAGASEPSSLSAGTMAGSPNLSTHAPLLDNALPASYEATAPSALTTALAKTRSAAMAPQPAPAPMMDLSPGIAVTPPAATPKPVVPRPVISAVSRDGESSGFSSSKYSVVEASEVAHDPELEEASIRFANGDDAGAEAGLLETLGPQGSRATHADTWLALFDLYRATGQHDKFENLAVEFVGRFDRSAPQWFSMPEMVQQLSNPAGSASPVTANGPAADWVCPSKLGIQTVAALSAALARAPMPWRLDWKNLKTIDENAVDSLCKVFSGWAAQPVQLRFMGEGELQRVLQDATPSGVRDTAQGWWQLRMETLRVTQQPDEFELTALDFCVTYEVSPPRLGECALRLQGAGAARKRCGRPGHHWRCLPRFGAVQPQQCAGGGHRDGGQLPDEPPVCG
ncbi:hypothetical protein [Polaromonas sp.]|uniref:hypothetical protein n=1 Tax=Polaromonas sp. TaxID=1869339 RepID=UPI0034218933